MDNTEKVEAITAEFQSYKADVSARVADLGAKIDALQQGVADGAETAALDKLLADVKSAHSELSDATNPAPEPEPITT